MLSIRALAFSTLLAAAPLAAQDAVVSYNVNLRVDPSTAQRELRLLLPGEELYLLSRTKQNNYYQVRTMAGEEGWAYSPRIRVLPPPPGPEAIFNACPMEGSATRADLQERNALKNRTLVPATVDAAITLQAMLQPGDDEDRFRDEQAAAIRGYVFDVKPGGAESVNCGATTLQFRDTHIEVTLSDSDTASTRRVIVEVTPKWREFMSRQGQDWSTAALRQLLEGNCAEFTGWLFWDAHHRGDAEHTDPGGRNNWRVTAWEVHPVTAIRVVPCQ